jgi:hypothetical protein
VPVGAERLAAWLHPVLAAASLVLLFYVASIGLRSRERGGAALRPRHARLAPVALWWMGFNAASGLLSTWLWRDDLELGDGLHFAIGIASVAVLGATAWLSRSLPEGDVARRLHPLLGMLAVLLASLQIFLGLPLLPL